MAMQAARCGNTGTGSLAGVRPTQAAFQSGMSYRAGFKYRDPFPFELAQGQFKKCRVHLDQGALRARTAAASFSVRMAVLSSLHFLHVGFVAARSVRALFLTTSRAARAGRSLYSRTMKLDHGAPAGFWLVKAEYEERTPAFSHASNCGTA